MKGQMSFFDGQHKFINDKPIRLIELFGGYGSQALALKYLGVPFEHHRLSEWAVKSIQAYKDMHLADDNTDYSKDMSVEQIRAWLYGKISADYSTPMTKQQINRLSEKQVRTIYNNMQATHNLGSITQIKAEDLAVVDTDKYCYIMTYSFPCQDLSNAGQQKGMAKGSETRSGLLWEVERLLGEMTEKPQILLMENVPQVVGKTGIKDFAQWLAFLEELGYKNYWQLMNAKDYGIPQNRNRCFMVSLLGDYYYSFPKPQKLTVHLKDFLDKKVDEKYCLSDKTVSGNKWDKLHDANRRVYAPNGLSPTLTTMGGGQREVKIIVPEATKKGYDTATYGDSINMAYPNSKTRRGRVGHGVAQTLTTGDSQQIIIEPIALDEQNGYMRQDGCVGTLTTDGSSPKHNNRIIEPRIAAMRGRNPDNPSDRTAGSPTEQRLEIGSEETSNTLTTVQKDNLVVEPNSNQDEFDMLGTIYELSKSYRIRKLTERECFRLQGVEKEDFERVAKNQSTSSLYHLCGDSIVTTCLMAIFGQLFGVDYETKINDLVGELKQ